MARGGPRDMRDNGAVAESPGLLDGPHDQAGPDASPPEGRVDADEEEVEEVVSSRSTREVQKGAREPVEEGVARRRVRGL